MAIEYAKIVKISANNGATNRGFQATLQLPSGSPAKKLPQAASYINSYVAVAGFECGVSTKNDPSFLDPSTGTYQWRWFVNGPQQAYGSYNQFRDGDSVSIKLSILSNGKVQFIVNGSVVFTSSGSHSPSSVHPARLIIAAEQVRWGSQPSSLPAWGLFHNQITASNMMFQNSGGTWVNVNSSNTQAELIRTPAQFSDAQTPPPVRHTVRNELANGRYYASLK